MRHNTLYTVLFATAICIVCGVLVSGAAVSLKARQEMNSALDKKKKVLEAAGLIEAGASVSVADVDRLFEDIETVAVDLRTGEESADFDTEGYDPLGAASDPTTSFEAPANASAIKRLPHYTAVYKIKDEAGDLSMLVLPIEGIGLWGTLYGFIALDSDMNTIRGLTYYKHKETPGLGGEVDNPRWKGLWPGRRAFGEDRLPKIAVIKGRAGPATESPYQVDGLSGATLTSRGVTNMLDFWLGERGFGPYLEKLAS